MLGYDKQAIPEVVRPTTVPVMKVIYEVLCQTTMWIMTSK